MKDTLIEIKNNYRETIAEWMKMRSKSIIWNTRKQNNQSEQHDAKGFKKETKHPKLCKKPWDNFKHSKICIMGCQKEKRKNKKWEICLKKR